MLKQLFILAAFGVLTSNAVFSQKNNRISIQSGLFNCFFDGTAIVNSEPIQGKYFKRRLLYSQGIEFMRRIKKSQISLEYMKFHGAYNYTLNLGNADATPQYMWKDLKFVSCFYNRSLMIGKHWDFQYGAGATYFWGSALLHHYAFDTGSWTESFVSGYKSQDVGLNLKVGVEYTPIKWLTIYSNFNFLGSVYQKNTIDFSQSYTSTYHKNIPSRYSLFLRFGIGFNFGK